MSTKLKRVSLRTEDLSVYQHGKRTAEEIIISLQAENETLRDMMLDYQQKIRELKEENARLRKK